MSEGTIIFLNGASSSGKTSIARALQRRLAEPYLMVGPDTLRPQLPKRYFDPDTGHIVHDPPEDHPAREAYYMTTITDGAARWYELHLGPVARRLTAGRQAAVAALAAAGNRLIVDEVLLDPAFLDTYLRVLRAFAVLFVGLRCPLEVLEQRERARGGPTGGARQGTRPPGPRSRALRSRGRHLGRRRRGMRGADPASLARGAAARRLRPTQGAGRRPARLRQR